MRVRLLLLSLMLWTGLVGLAGNALAISTETPMEPPPSFPGEFTLELSASDFLQSSVMPMFGNVRRFTFEFDLAGPLESGRYYENDDILDVRYLVSGSLNIDPPTPSGFAAFRLNRQASGEGTISREEWANQGSEFLFKIAHDAHFLDGIQLSELVSLNAEGAVLIIDAREFKRLDRARYHPPQIILYADGTGQLRNSNNSSGGTGTMNPGTGLLVDVAFGEEYITKLNFDPSAITIIDAPGGTVVPEPGTGLLMGLGLAGLAIAGGPGGSRRLRWRG